MAKIRVHELAKQANISSKEMLALLQKAGLDVKTASSGVSDEVAERVMKAVNRPVGARAASGRPPAQRSNGSGNQSRPQQRSFSAAPGDAPPRRGPSGTPGGANRPGGGRPGGAPATGGGGGGGAGGKMRRVVIDSQAARRGPGGPPQMQPARKSRGGRRRRPVFEEPVEKIDDPALEALSKIVRIDSGATVKEVSESLGVSSA